MARKQPFPKLIHVTHHEDTDSTYFLVHEGGVFDIDEHDTPVAVYQLVETGKIDIKKTFVRTGLPKNTQKYNSPVKA